MQKLLYWFHGDFLACAGLALELGFAYVMKQSPATHLTYVDLFSSGLSGFVAFRKTRKRKYKRLGKKMRQKMKGIIKKGNPNFHHEAMILDAEYFFVQGRANDAIRLYEKAIVFCARGGFLMHAGVAAERLGNYCFERDQSDAAAEKGRQSDALFRLEQAIQFYRAWGAHRKVGLLQEENSSLWPKPAEIVAKVND